MFLHLSEVTHAWTLSSDFRDSLLLHWQDPLKASDKPLTDCGPYILDEEDAMVYRRPYLTSGASGFALVALSRNLKNELKVSVSKPWSNLI